VDDIKTILQEIKSGKKSFQPRSSAESDMVEFQSIAKTLVHANEEGYLDGLRSHREGSTSNGWYDLVVVMNGLSFKGEAFLMDSVATNAVEANESIPLPVRGSVSAEVSNSMAEHFHILELASRNELPQVVDRKGPVSLQVTYELVQAGYLSGAYANSTNGTSVIAPAITLPGRLFLEERKRVRDSSQGRGAQPRVTLDTNCVINLFDRQSASASSIPELNKLIRYGLSGRITVAITTRVETDLLNDKEDNRRSEMLQTLANFSVIGTVGRWGASKWGSGDVFSYDKIQQQRDDIQGIVFPGLTTQDKRYSNKRNDVDHLLGHLLNRQDIFVTDDKDILRCSQQLQRSQGIVVMSPRQIIEYLDAI
jgi:hypothetical protein